MLFRQDDTALKQVFIELLAEFGGLDLDWSTETSAVRKFGTKFWDRASFDLGAALEPNGTGPLETGSFEEADFEWWWETISANEFSRLAFQDFKEMWVGASQQTPGLAKVTLKEVLMFMLRTDVLSVRLIP